MSENNTITFYVPIVSFDRYDANREISVCLTKNQRDIAEKILRGISGMKHGFSYYFAEVEHTREEKE